jgi:hypothetical protein
MPILQNVKTISAEEIWRKGDRVIHEVVLQIGDKQFKAKTYSGAIANTNFSGNIESYEKPNSRGGTETFVRQEQKEGGSHGAYPSKGSGARGDSNPFTMYLSYAKDILVALIAAQTYDPAFYHKLLENAVEGGNYLYEHRPDATPSEQSTAKTPAATAAPLTVADHVFEGAEALSLDDIPDLNELED